MRKKHFYHEGHEEHEGKPLSLGYLITIMPENNLRPKSLQSKPLQPKPLSPTQLRGQ